MKEILHILASTNIEEVHYDTITKELKVLFKSGAWYSYDNVPKNVYEGFQTAESAGSYFNQFVKKAGYSYRKVSN